MQYILINKINIKKFILLSGACAPIVNFNVMYNNLINNNKSWFYMTPGERNYYHPLILKKHGGIFYWNDLGYHSQWCSIDINHAKMFFYPNFEKTYYVVKNNDNEKINVKCSNSQVNYIDVIDNYNYSELSKELQLLLKSFNGGTSISDFFDNEHYKDIPCAPSDEHFFGNYILHVLTKDITNENNQYIETVSKIINDNFEQFDSSIINYEINDKSYNMCIDNYNQFLVDNNITHYTQIKKDKTVIKYDNLIYYDTCQLENNKCESYYQLVNDSYVKVWIGNNYCIPTFDMRNKDDRYIFNSYNNSYLLERNNNDIKYIKFNNCDQNNSASRIDNCHIDNQINNNYLQTDYEKPKNECLKRLKSSTYTDWCAFSIDPSNIIRGFNIYPQLIGLNSNIKINWGKINANKILEFNNPHDLLFELINCDKQITVMNYDSLRDAKLFVNNKYGTNNIVNLMVNHPREYTSWSLKNMTNVYVLLLYLKNIFLRDDGYNGDWWHRRNFKWTFDKYQQLILDKIKKLTKHKYLQDSENNIIIHSLFGNIGTSDIENYILCNIGLKKYYTNTNYDKKLYGSFITPDVFYSAKFLYKTLFIRKCGELSGISAYTEFIIKNDNFTGNKIINNNLNINNFIKKNKMYCGKYTNMSN